MPFLGRNKRASLRRSGQRTYRDIGLGLLRRIRSQGQNLRGRGPFKLRRGRYGEGITSSKRMIGNRFTLSKAERSKWNLLNPVRLNQLTKVVAYSQTSSAASQQVGQMDYDSPYQGCHTSDILTKNELKDLYTLASQAGANSSDTTGFAYWGQTFDQQFGADDNPTRAWCNTFVVYGLNVVDTIINSCNLTQEFDVYLIGSKRPLTGNVAGDLNSLIDYERAETYGQDSALGNTMTFNNGSVAKEYPNTPGWYPMKSKTLREYYKVKARNHFVLKPGEQKNLTYAVKSGFRVNGFGFHTYSEVPGVTHHVIVIARTQVVGGDAVGSTSAVGYGNGQYQHIRRMDCKAKWLPNGDTVLRATRTSLDTIAASDQEFMNPETRVRTADEAEL